MSEDIVDFGKYAGQTIEAIVHHRREGDQQVLEYEGNQDVIDVMWSVAEAVLLQPDVPTQAAVLFVADAFRSDWSIKFKANVLEGTEEAEWTTEILGDSGTPLCAALLAFGAIKMRDLAEEADADEGEQESQDSES